MNDGWLKRSVMLRMIIIGVLSLLLLIPSFLVMGLMYDRKETRDRAIADVSEKWGGAQTFAGPVLTIPFKRTVRADNGEVRITIEHAQLLPESVRIAASTTPEVRYRGLYQVILYNAGARIQGKFSLDGLAALNVKPDDVIWNETSLSMGISDLKGIKDAVTITWGGEDYLAEPGVASCRALQSGISITPHVAPDRRQYEFATTINVNGSGEVQFVPVGKVTEVSVTSSWPSPSFVGRFLPDRRDVRDDGFTADWKVLHLNRNFPQQWISEGRPAADEAQRFDLTSFGVKLVLPVDGYQQATRSAKYAIMFISLTFLAFFLTEVLNKKVAHPVHYALIGFALVLFYSLLISLSEHMAFAKAYLISSGAIVALVGAYTRSVLGANRFAATISSLLVLLYTFLYVILQEEDYALLVGSIGLFVVLALVMYLTRKIDWYAIGTREGVA
jgi:inner membrane protein